MAHKAAPKKQHSVSAKPDTSTWLAARHKRSRKGYVMTDERVERICESFGAGVPLATCLAAEAIQRSTWQRAMERPHNKAKFLAARGRFLQYAVARLSGHDDWRALAWILERRHNDLFQKPVEVQQTNVVNVSQSLPQDLLARARELASSLKSADAPAASAQARINGDSGQEKLQP